jgi:hypothetical protein
MQLTEHFSLEEMLASETANNQQITEQFSPSDVVVANLKNLCIYILEPLRAKISAARGQDTPIHITSGYRCPRLNEAVGGVPDSQHMTGEAADTHVDCMSVEGWYQFIKSSGLVFDQLLQEFDEWAHISHSVNNRGECWMYIKGARPKRD